MNDKEQPPTNTRPILSVVIDNYNYEQYVGQAIESVLRQDLDRTEVVVVDDGSTDDSLRRIDAFADRVRVVEKSNGGQGSALNAGFEAAQGDWILYLDADDLLLGDPLDDIAAFGEPTVSCLNWQMPGVDHEGSLLGSLHPPEPPPASSCLEKLIECGPLSFPFVPCSGNIWPRWFLERVMPMPEPPFRHDADVYLVNLAVIYGQSRFCEKPLSAYRQHAENYMATKNAFEVRDLLRSRMADLSAIVVDHLTKQRIDHDPGRWTNESWNELDEIERAIREAVPEGASLVLLDNGRLGVGDSLFGRKVSEVNQGDFVVAIDDALSSLKADLPGRYKHLVSACELVVDQHAVQVYCTK